MSTVRRREPLFNTPAVVVWMLGALIAVHVIRQFLPPAWDEELILRLAFVPARLGHDVVGLPSGAVYRYGQFVTHTLLHADLTHLGFNGLWLLAGATLVARRVGAWRTIVIGLCSAATGALMFALLNSEPRAVVLGASGGISGLLGAATRLIHAAAAAGDSGALRDRVEQLPRPSLMAALSDRQVLISSTAFIGLNIAIAFGFGSDLSANGIAWQSHVGGYLFGLLAFDLLDRPPVAAEPAAVS